jgi:hypothetical protein
MRCARPSPPPKGSRPGGHEWSQALANLGHRLPVDALAHGNLAQLSVRAATLLDLPDATTVDSLADIQQLIRFALLRGTERFNRGDVRGCCMAYWASGQVLLAVLVSRGVRGGARVLAPIRQAHDPEAPSRPLDESEMRFFAWALRLGFDGALKAIQETGQPLQ